MKLHDFIECTIISIKKGVDDFNQQETRAHAYMPEEITFDVWVNEIWEVTESKENTNLKFKINTVTYAFDKK